MTDIDEKYRKGHMSFYEKKIYREMSGRVHEAIKLAEKARHEVLMGKNGKGVTDWYHFVKEHKK